jgi:cell wall-associated NlpC family hydrolase
MIFGLVLAALVLSGCSASSPRFRGTGGGTYDEENELRFASRIREEVRREDDRTVSAEETSRRLSRRTVPAGKYSNQTPTGLNRDRFLMEVIGYLGVPYVWGGNGREGIDCSGFTAQVYKTAAKKLLPRSAREQFGAGPPVSVAELQFGDLVFFNTTGRVPSHVGVYIEDDLFAHASVTRGVTLSSLESTYYKKRYVGARRIVRDPAD